MKKKLLWKTICRFSILITMLGFASNAMGLEALLVDENFQSWNNFTASASTPSTVVSKKTLIGDDFTYTLSGVSVSNTGKGNASAAIASDGYLKMHKNTEVAGATYDIIISALPSVTRMWFIEYATGGSRGFQVWKKTDTDADWVNIHNTAGAQNGSEIPIPLNATNVSIKFTNISAGNYAFLSDLKIWGDAGDAAIPPTIVSYSPDNNSYIPSSGAVTVTFSEAVTRSTGDITIGSITIPDGNISINGEVVTINYSGLNTDANYTMTIPAGAFKNAAGTATASATTISYKSPDTVKPTITKISYVDGATIPESGIITLVLSETINSGTVNATLGTKSVAATAVSGKNIATISYSSLTYGETLTLTIPKEALKDNYGNALAQDYIYTYTVEDDTKGNEIINFSNPVLTDYNTTGTKVVAMNGIDVTFDIDAVAATRNNGGYTSAVKCNAVTFAPINSVGKFQFYIQNGSGSDTKEFYVEKLVGETWQRVEAFIIPGNGGLACVSVNAKSSDPVTLKITGETTFWLYQMAVYDFKDNSPVDDGLPPYVVSSVPQGGDGNISINGTIKLTFNESVTLGTGAITLDGKTLTPTITGANVTIPYTNLKYATSYTLTVPAGAIKDKFNTDCDVYTLSFTTKAKPVVTPKLFDLVVGPDLADDYSDIQEAFNAVPENNTVPFRIFVKNGEYNYGYGRLILASNKGNVSLIGQSKDGVIIKGDNYVDRLGTGNPGTNNCAVIDILANDFYGENFTVINTAGIAQTERAVCIRTTNDRIAMNNVSLQGGQDILYTNTTTGRQYFKNSSFSGTVDYIFGGGDVLFDNCQQYTVKRNGTTDACVITAPSTLNTLQWGYVFLNNTINGDASQDGKYLLGRPWQNAPRSIWINTTMNILPTASGWGDMQVIPALFAEYNSLKANGTAVDLSQRKTEYNGSTSGPGTNTKTTLTEAEAAAYTPENIFGLWNAVALTEATAAPANLTLSANTLSWDAVDGATCYVILRGNNVIGFSATNSYSDPSVTAEATPYYVMAAAESGALSLLSEASSGSTGCKTITTANKAFLKSTLIKNQLELISVDEVAKIEIFDLSGKKVQSNSVSSANIAVSLTKGIYLVKGTAKTGETMIAKIVKE